jgi:uncharacterized protein (TIGR00730 family)
MNTKRKTTVSVFCASENGNSGVYMNAMRDLGQQLALNDINVVYGGGRSGLMGVLNVGVTECDGSMTALIPPIYFNPNNQYHPNVDVVRCDDATDRLNRFMQSDFNIVAPGGFGTMGEIGVAMTHVVDSFHAGGDAAAPLIFFNVNGCWDPIRQQAELIVQNGFGKDEARRAFIFTDQPSKIIETITSSAPRLRRA